MGFLRVLIGQICWNKWQLMWWETLLYCLHHTHWFSVFWSGSDHWRRCIVIVIIITVFSSWRWRGCTLFARLNNKKTNIWSDDKHSYGEVMEWIYDLLTDWESLSVDKKKERECQDRVFTVKTVDVVFLWSQKQNWPDAEKLRYFCFPLVES